MARAAGPIDEARGAFGALDTYTVTLRSGGGADGEVIRYFFKKPGYVRMEFVRPHRGALLVYDPEAGVVHLRPFGFLKPLVLTLKPGNRLIRSSGGHTVDESDIGSLLDDAAYLQDSGSAETAGEEELNGRRTTLVEVRGGGDESPHGVARYLLWMDEAVKLPLRADAYGADGILKESVLMDDLEVDPELSPGLFELK